MSNTKKMWIRILCLAFALFTLFALNSCDETDANVECEHTWSDWSVITEASCEEDGEKQRVCSECDETEKEAIAALSHDFGEWSVTKAATCTEDGEETRVCSRDSEHTETRTVAKIAHTFDVEKEDVAYLKEEGSCTEKAVYYKSCKCGEKGTETFESGTPSHTYDKEVVDAKYLKSEATCTAKAVYYKSCECGAFDAETSETFESGATVPHAYGESVVAPKYLKSEATCTEKAVYYKSCTCGAFDALTSETFESGEFAPHVYDRAVVDAKFLKSEADCDSAAVYYKSCKCGAFDTGASGTFENGDKAPHVYDREVAATKYIKTPASCTEAAVYYKSCKCGEKGSDTFRGTELNPHNYDQRVVDAKFLKSEATCTAKAVYYKSCKCGNFDAALSDTFKSGEMLPHTYDKEIVSSEYLKTPASCTELAVYYKSCKCGAKGSATFEYGELLAHVYNKEVVDARYLASEATCTELATYYKSCECGAFDTALSATFSGGELLPHVYDKTVVADKYLKSEATCTEAAVYYKSCKCGEFDRYDSETFENGNPIAHTYNKEVVDAGYLASEATCTAAARYYKSCECGAFDADLSATFEDGEPIAHTYDREVVDPKYFASDATCETRARYYKSCKCGAHDNALSETFEYGELTGHNHVQVGFTAATCTVDGVKTEECTVCGDTINTPIIAQGHSYVDEIVEPKCLTVGYTKHTCSECGDNYTDSEVPATGHLVFDDNVIAATCEEDGYTEHKCRACGYIENINPTTKLGHDYQEQTLTPADCKNTGTKKISCSRCDYENTETIPTTDHNHSSVTTPATCTVDGYITYTCVCGDTYTVAGETAQGHSWSKTPFAPTCTEQGYTLWECDNCDAEEKHDFVAENGHSFSAATCAEPEKCACGAIGAAATGDHNYVGVETTAPTCTVKGVMTYTCGTCGDSYTDDISATGHNTEGAVWTETEQCIDGKCTYVKVSSTTCLNDNCGETITETSASYEKHSYQATITQAATCTVPGIKTYKCTVCGGQPAENATVTYSEASGHSWDETASTSTTKSYECSACHETKTVVHSDGNSANVGASDLNASGGVNLGGTEIELDDATKTQLEGITATDDITVSVNKIEGADRNDLVSDAGQLEYIGNAPIYDLTMLIGGDENNKISDFDGKVTVRIPYTLEDGDDPENLTIWYIDDNGEVSTVDGATYVVIGDQGYAVFETDHFSYYTVTKLTPEERCTRDGHIKKTIIQEANCLVGGYVKVVCTRCGEVIKNETTPALGHNWTHNVISEATCDTAGKTEHSCDRCRLVYYTVTAAVGHKWTESKTVEATCSEAGYILYVCESNEAHTYKVAIPKSSHSYVSETVEATCTSEGYTKHVCSECGVSYVTNRVNAKGHSIITKVVEPTCISEGYTAQSCEHCGQRFENINPTPTVDHVWDIEAPTCSKGQTCTVCNAAGAAATGEHNMTEKGECSECGKACEHKFYQGEVHAPTCIENGYTEYVCNFCGIVENRDIVEHGDHTWKNAEHKAATCTDDGYDKWICSVCGETKTETIPHGDGFHKEATKVVAPTCEGEGYTLRYCRICETEIERTNIVEATGHRYATVETVEPTCEDDGYITVKCAGCGDEATKVLEAKGHSHELYKTIEPTCDKAGADIYKCIACDSSYEKEIAPKGHNYEHYETIEPTCDKAGADVYKCTACDSSYEKEIAPKGHSYEHYDTIEPTCDKAGADVYKCTACDSSYEKEIAPKGHDYELYETVDSTCEVNGKKIYKCTACDSTEEEELELADHKYVDGKCEVCGKEQSDCVHLELEDCDKSYKFVNDSAHSCNDGVEVIYTCPNCEQVVLKEIKDSHTYEYNDFADIGVAGNVWVRSCVICNEGDVNIEFYGCKFRTTEKEYVDDEGYPHYAETFVCVDCGFSYVRDVRLIEDGCYVAYEYTYTFGSEAWGKQYTAVVVNFVESHNYKTEWTESVDEENLIFSKIGVRACTECGKVFLRSTETMKYLAEDVPYEYTSVTELALDDKGTEFVIVEKEIQRAEYKITEDGEYIPVGFEENEFTYDSKGNPASLEENIERYTEEGEVEYFYAAFYYYIGGEKQLMDFEEEEYTTITLPGGYEKNFIVSNKAGEYDINGELVDSYSETYAYEIIEGESCAIKVTYTDSEGNVETYVDDVHPNIEKTWEFATEIQDCNQGIYIIEKCTVCGEEINREYRSHHNTITTEEDHIDASELGCACGGYVAIARCQYCDYETVYYHFNCQIATEDSDSSYDDSYGEIVIVKPEVSFGDSDIAVEDTVIGEGTGSVIDGVTKPSTSTSKTGGTCQICGFTYSVESYSEVGDNCQVIRYYTYSFGMDAEGNPIKVIEIVDDSTYRHSYTNDSNIVSDTYETQADGSVLFVTVTETKTYCVTCGHVLRNEVITIKRDGDGFILYDERATMTGDGDESYVSERIVSTYERYTRPDGSIETRLISWTEYRYNQLGEETYFSKTTHIYNEENPCVVTIIREDSNGDRDEYMEENHDFESRYVLVDGAESCEDGVRVLQVCRICETEIDNGEIITWHNEQHEHVDLSAYGSICGSFLEISRCACGQYSNVYFERAGMFDSKYTSYVDENGNKHRVERGECMADGFWYEIDYYSVEGENCTVTEYYVYRFGNSTSPATLLEKSIVRVNRNAHSYQHNELVNENYQETDETGATLNVHIYEASNVCTNCGYVSDHFRETRKTDMLGNEVYCLNEHFYTNSDGVEYIHNSNEFEYQVVELANGETVSVIILENRTDYNVKGEVDWFERVSYEYYDGYCKYTAHITNSEGYESFEKGENHGELVRQLTLIDGATSCDQGVKVSNVCALCGEEAYSDIFYHHYSVSEWIDLAQYGSKCGGELYLDYCACGFQSYVSVNSNCIFEKSTSNVVDENGNRHNVTTHVCMNCSFSYTIESWTEQDAFCHSYGYTAYNIGIDAEGNAMLVKIAVKDRGENHKLVSEGGNTVESTETDENGNVLNVYTNEINEYCEVCGTVVNHNVSVEKTDSDGNCVYRSETYYGFADGAEYVSSFHEASYITVTLENGKTRRLVVKESNYKYESNGNILDFVVFEYEYAEGDYCNATVTRTDLYGTNTYNQDMHGDIKESATLMDGATNCYDGVIITHTCLECGKIVNTEETYGHYRFNETIYLEQYGSLCGDFIEINTCPCGIKDNIYLGHMCNYVCYDSKYESQNGYDYIYEAYRCSSCEFVYTYERWVEIDESCNGTRYTKYSFGQDENGAPVFEKTITGNMGKVHSYVNENTPVESDETDENGNALHVITTEYLEYCQNCKTINHHSVVTEKFDANQNLVYRETNTYFSDEGGEYLSDTVTSTFETLIKADGTSFNYESSREVRYHYGIDAGYWCKYTYRYNDGDYCTKYVTMTDAYGKTNEYTEGSHGETITVLELKDGVTNCEQGVIVREVCADCGTEFFSNEYYYHYTITETIDLSELGCGCGGQISVNSCACGYQASLNVMAKCPLRSTTEKVEREDGTTYNVRTYICDTCGFSYIYEYWTEYDENCNSYQHRIYRFGLDDEGNPLLVKELKLNRGQEHSYSGAASEEVVTTEKDEAGNELRVVTITTTNSCTRCGKLTEMTVSVEKYAVVDEKTGDEVCVYRTIEFYQPSTEAENGLYLQRKHIEEYAHSTTTDGYVYTHLLLEYTEYYDIYGNVSDFEKYEYSYEDGSYCKATVIYTNYYGDKREETRENHISTYYSFVLSEGSETCEDGLDFVNLCSGCGEEIYRHTNYSYEHNFKAIPEIVMPLEDYGCVCGGELQILTCPCGQRTTANIISDCPFNFTGEYYTYTTESGESCMGQVMTCPVTDPELCGFSYVYLDWTTSDENCKAIQHIVVLLGFDSKTGEYAEKYENTYELGDYDHNLFYQEIPTYDDEGNHTGFITTETCQRCGAVTYKRITVLYTDENGDEVSEHDSYYYDVDAGESKVRNHERKTYIRRTVLLKNGETRSVEILSRTELYGDDEVIDYWTEYVYSYDDEFCCTGTRTYRRYDQNKGDIYEDTYTIDNHGMSNTETIVENTCTQNGIVVYRCVYCEYSRESETYSMGHSYRNVSADLWECTRCGLQNFTGADGEVIFEDLTADRGNGSQYVVGYRNHWGSDYVFSLYLVVDGEENPVELEVVDDGTSLVYIDAYAVAEMAKAMGYKPCDYMVCLRFVPIGDDFGYYYDFAITLDPHVYALDAENCVTPDTPCVDETVTAYKCAICGDIYTESTILEHDIEWISYSIGECGSAINCEVCKTCNKTFTIERYIACPFEMTAATETDENGVVHSIETYVCGICGASYQVEYYTLSNGDCFGENYEITRWGLQDDGSYSFEVVMSEQTENHVYTTTSDKTEDGLTVTVVKKTACQSCGKTSNQSINVTVLDENGNTVSQLTESWSGSGFYKKNFSEYFYTEDGTRYVAFRTYEQRDSDGVVLKGYTTVYEYNFEAGVRYWTRTDINGMVTTGEEIITSK